MLDVVPTVLSNWPAAHACKPPPPPDSSTGEVPWEPGVPIWGVFGWRSSIIEARFVRGKNRIHVAGHDDGFLACAVSLWLGISLPAGAAPMWPKPIPAGTKRMYVHFLV